MRTYKFRNRELSAKMWTTELHTMVTPCDQKKFKQWLLRLNWCPSAQRTSSWQSSSQHYIRKWTSDSQITRATALCNRTCARSIHSKRSSFDNPVKGSRPSDSCGAGWVASSASSTAFHFISEAQNLKNQLELANEKIKNDATALNDLKNGMNFFRCYDGRKILHFQKMSVWRRICRKQKKSYKKHWLNRRNSMRNLMLWKTDYTVSSERLLVLNYISSPAHFILFIYLFLLYWTIRKQPFWFKCTYPHLNIPLRSRGSHSLIRIYLYWPMFPQCTTLNTFRLINYICEIQFRYDW